MTSATEPSLIAMAFPSPDVGYVSDQGGAVYKTADGGRSWSLVLQGDGRWFHTLVFPDETFGLVGARNRLLRTHDGGRTWERLTSNIEGEVMGQYFPLAPGAPGRPASEPEQASTRVTERGRYFFLGRLYFLSRQVGYAMSLDGLLCTQDGGGSWAAIDTGGSAGNGLHGMCWPTPDMGIAVGDGSTILRLAPFGRTVERVASPSQEEFQAVAFTSARDGYAVGALGQVVSTHDGGVTWTSQQIEPPPHLWPPHLHLLGLAFFDAVNGTAVALTGELVRTQDGGATWTVTPLRRRLMIGAICAPSATTGYILAAGRRLFKTTDAGATYHVLSVPTQR
ncbi:MAG: hypothetical protein JWO59_2208 [Chloroflexi bacterium]|nr:hypothetical protein [Chloroflexota bacterium]